MVIEVLGGGGPADKFPGRGLNSIFENICVFFQFYLIVFIHHSIQPKILRTTKKVKETSSQGGPPEPILRKWRDMRLATPPSSTA